MSRWRAAPAERNRLRWLSGIRTESPSALPARCLEPHAVIAVVLGGARRRPALEELVRELVDLDAERPADLERIARLGPPERHREIAAGAGRERAEQVDLREHLEIVALPRRRGLHEVLVLAVEAGALEDVQH